VHAGARREGLIDSCDLVFLAKSKDGDYHQEMNSVVFLEWFENPLMPAKTIKRLPLPEGIFGASDPSFGSHI
jgi:hypothetical protein